MENKECKTCGERQPLSSFYKSSSCKEGVVGICRTCRAAIQRGVSKGILYKDCIATIESKKIIPIDAFRTRKMTSTKKTEAKANQAKSIVSTLAGINRVRIITGVFQNVAQTEMAKILESVGVAVLGADGNGNYRWSEDSVKEKKDALVGLYIKMISPALAPDAEKKTTAQPSVEFDGRAISLQIVESVNDAIREIVKRNLQVEFSEIEEVLSKSRESVQAIYRKQVETANSIKNVEALITKKAQEEAAANEVQVKDFVRNANLFSGEIRRAIATQGAQIEKIINSVERLTKAFA